MKALFLFLIPGVLILGDPPSINDFNLSSTHASYNGENIILRGNVFLDHAIGNLSSEEAFLEKEQGESDLPFSKIQLKKNVTISLKNKTSLSCEQAELDFLEMKGNLSSIGDNLVVYTDKMKGIGEDYSSLQMQSKSIDLLFLKQEKEGSSFEYMIKTLIAKEKVVINYAKEFILKSDEAIYQKNASLNDPLKGYIKAYPTGLNPYAELCYQEQLIQTTFIEVDAENNLLKLKNPKGTLPSQLFSEKEEGRLSFTSQELDWDHAKKVLTLRKEIEIQESHFGSLSAEKELTITQQDSEGKAAIKVIHVTGKSILSHKEASLTCLGHLHIDGLKGQITALSPKDKQLIYENGEMTLRANQAFLEYTEPSYELTSLLLKGAVSLQSHDAQKPRCALGDRLTYAPHTKTIILSANPGKKVLFHDQEQGITMSAEEVHFTENPLTNKPEIKGVGTMKILLSQEESDLLKKTFPNLYPPILEASSHE